MYSVKKPLPYKREAVFLEKVCIMSFCISELEQGTYIFFYPTLMGSKTPTSKFSESKEVRWGI
ncbi:hypothetical protein ACQVPP_27505, partial [Bacillus luti]|uniref:hypothetical protein n=1 Tax=Bacillus luti TaxID=2026191 RepID=UPI003D652A19